MADCSITPVRSCHHRHSPAATKCLNGRLFCGNPCLEVIFRYFHQCGVCIKDKSLRSVKSKRYIASSFLHTTHMLLAEKATQTIKAQLPSRYNFPSFHCVERKCGIFLPASYKSSILDTEQLSWKRNHLLCCELMLNY